MCKWKARSRGEGLSGKLTPEMIPELAEFPGKAEDSASASRVGFLSWNSAFNEVDDGIIAVAGLVGAALGWTDLGLLGAVLGLWAGVSLCGMALEGGRPIRR